MPVNSKYLKNTQNSFQFIHNKKQRGGKGIGQGVSFSSLNNSANSGLGHMRARGLAYTQCPQEGGNGYGFNDRSAAESAAFRGSYPALSTYSKAKQCGGKRRKRSKTKKRRKSRKRKNRRSRRRRRRRRKSKKGGRTKNRKTRRRTGTLNTLANPRTMRRRMRGGSTVSYGSAFPNSKPWALGPVAIQTNKHSCFDNYSHGKK